MMRYYESGIAEELITNAPTIEYKKFDPKSKKTLKIEEIDITCCFDIETSSYYLVDGVKKRVDDSTLLDIDKIPANKRNEMYIWMFGIGDTVIYGRTWAELQKLYYDIVKAKGKRRLTVWVHNLAYEYQYIRKLFGWTDVFAIDTREVVRAETIDDVVFRCSYKESGKSLETIGKEVGTEKKVGDLDYLVIRDEETDLTDTELGYCEYDIRVLKAYIDQRARERGGRNQILLTKTAYVREYMRNNTLYFNDSKKICYTYKDIMDRLKITSLAEYNALKAAFQGGFTHANVLYSGQTLHDVHSYDLSSSYPATLACERFPMSSATYYESPSIDFVEKDQVMNVQIMHVIYYDIERATDADDPISISKCVNSTNPIIDNGRVIKADAIETYITSVDYNLYKRFYTYDECEVLEMWSYYADYLPRRFILAMLELYAKKTKLKGIEGSEIEYALTKELLNSTYGMIVQDIVRQVQSYDLDGWHTTPGNVEEMLEQYNESKARFTFYPWGVFCTAYSRKRLLDLVYMVGADHVYSDTDSEKMLHPERHIQDIELINEYTKAKLHDMCDYHNIDEGLTHPVDKKGREHPLGAFELDGTYSTFKTLGAKRYMYKEGEDDEVHITIAGVSKRGGKDYFNMLDDPFTVFKDKVVIPAIYANKLTATYIDDQDIPSVFMAPSDYRLSLSPDYSLLLSGERYLRQSAAY